MRELIAERAWLTVFLLPAYSPDLNPVEWVWAHVKRSLANLAVMALDRLEALVRNRLKRLQYRPDTLDDLGRQIGASARTLSRHLRDDLGLTYPQWRTQIRLHHALILLADGALVWQDPGEVLVANWAPLRY
ncbi:hypothetical protein EAO76_00935 [Streptomyces sp. sk2.1]|nr:hypothetical protein EAO76_00935 [Streptomyces sp. sk2.1]